MHGGGWRLSFLSAIGRPVGMQRAEKGVSGGCNSLKCEGFHEHGATPCSGVRFSKALCRGTVGWSCRFRLRHILVVGWQRHEHPQPTLMAIGASVDIDADQTQHHHID